MRPRTWPLGLVVVAALIRIPTLGSQSFWRDEVITVNLLHKSFGGMLDRVVDLESTPPLYYAVAWVWARVFGFGEAGLRSLSLVFGALTVAVIYKAAEAAASHRAAVIAALLAAVNPFLVWYSQEARSYALFVFLTSCSLLWFVRVLKHPSRRNLALWSGTSALALAAHYFAAFLVGAEALWLLAAVARRRDVIAWSAPWVLVGLALAPLAHAQGDHASWISESGALPARLKESEVRQIALLDATRRLAGAPRIHGFRLSAERTSKAISIYIYDAAAPMRLTAAGLGADRPEPAVARTFSALQLPSGAP